MSLGLALAVFALMLILNAVLVASEYALVAIRPTQVEALRLRSPASRRVAALARLKEDPGSTLAAIQVGITMTNLLLGWIGEPAVSAVIDWALGPLAGVLSAALVRGTSFAVAFLLITLLTVVLSELLPKVVTLRHVEGIATACARPVLVLRGALWPLVRAMNAVANAITRPLGLGRVDRAEGVAHTHDEIRVIATEAAADGVLTPAERSLILNTLSLGKRTARQIMVSRIHVEYLDLKRTMNDNLKVLENHLYSRLPLCDGGMDKVFGVVSTKEFLMAYADDGDPSVMQLIARPAAFVPETLTVDKLFPMFGKQGTQMLFLVSEYGGVEGIVTLKDVVDELLREAAATTEAASDNPAPAQQASKLNHTTKKGPED
jgi:CBS domain containing-hemolysin-like protein